MRKVIALGMILSILIINTAYGAPGSVSNTSNPNPIPITATVEEAVPVYSINIKWSALTFKYTNDGVRWDDKTTSYVSDIPGKWEANPASANMVGVENHSNAEVKVSFRFEHTVTSNGEYDALRGQFSKNGIVLESAEGRVDANGNPTEGDIAQSELTIVGDPINKVFENANIGRVVISVNDTNEM